MKVKQLLYRPGQTLRVPGGLISRQLVHQGGKVVSPTHPAATLTPHKIFLVLISLRLSRSMGHSAAGRIMSMKNYDGITENQTRYLLASSSVPQPAAPPHAPNNNVCQSKITRTPEIVNNEFCFSQTH
jgi:hypothetical protein